MIRRQKSPVPADEGSEESESSEEMFKQCESSVEVSDAYPKLQKTSSNTNEEKYSDSDESVSQQKQQQQQTVESPKAAEMPLIPAVAKASCLSTDTLPLQPREVTETIERHQLAELKEQETANGDQTSSGGVSCVTSGDELPCESMHKLVPEETQPHHIEELKEPDNQCLRRNNDATNPIGLASSPEVGSTSRSVDKTFSHDRTSTPSDGTIIAPHPIELSIQQESIKGDYETTLKEYIHRVPPLCNRDNQANTKESGIENMENMQQSAVPIQEPPENWEYNDLLVDLNNMITTAEELHTMTDKFRSEFT